MKSAIIEACKRAIPEAREYQESAWRGLSQDTRDGVLSYWEPGYSYSDTDFWECCTEEDIDPLFIWAVRLYDTMQKD